MDIETLDAAQLRARAGRQFIKAYVLGALSLLVGGGLIAFMIWESMLDAPASLRAQDPNNGYAIQAFIVGFLILSLGCKKALSIHADAHGLLYKAVLKK